MEARAAGRKRLWVGLGPQVIGLVLIAVVLTGGLIGWLVTQNSRSVLRESVLSRNLATAVAAGDLAAQFVDVAETSLDHLGDGPLFGAAVRERSVEAAEPHMEQLMQISGRFDSISVYTPDGIGWASGLKTAWQYRGGSVVDRDWFRGAVATKKPYLGVPMVSRETGHPVVSYAIPLLDDQGEVNAVLVGSISLSTLSNAITSIAVSPSTQLNLVDTRQGGLIVADSDPALVLQSVGVHDQAVIDALAGGKQATETSGPDGTALVAFAPVQGVPWTVLIREPAKTAFASVDAATRRALFIVAGILVAALIASVLLARRITSPLRHLARGADEVGGGNLNYQIGMVRRDEIGVVSQAFDRMTRELRGTLVSRDELAAEVTKDKYAEETLRELADRQEAILEAVPDILMEVNDRRVYTWANQAGFAFFGDDVVGKDSSFYLAGDEEQCDGIATLLESGQELAYFESWQRRKDGQKHLLAWMCRSLRDDQGRISGALGSAMDITERRRAEEALRTSEELLRQSQKMEAVGQLAGGIAHDFNNLLTAILGYTDLLLATREGQAETLRPDLMEIKHAAERASSLTRQILAFSRRQALRPAVVSLNDIVAGMEPLLRRTLCEDCELVTKKHPSLWTAELDVNQFEQVIMNLALNSRDAMPAGGRLLIETGNVDLDPEYCATHAEVEPGPYVMLSVADNGLGMDARTLSRIFEPFFTTKAPGTGTGLGLSMVYGIVRQSGGNIDVWSEPGRGTVIKVYVPRADGSQPDVAPSEQALPGASGRGTVLVVEDEESLRRLVTRVLRSLGYTVLTAATADEALVLAQELEKPIDLLLTDVVLPGAMQGNDLARCLVAERPHLPVLYMSGYTRDAIVHAGRLDEGVQYLAKPFTPDTLAATVAEVLAKAGR